MHYLTSIYSPLRLLVVSVMLATKYFDDRYYNNEYYARIGGIGNAEINLLERDFL